MICAMILKLASEQQQKLPKAEKKQYKGNQMKHQLNDIDIHIATGGRKFDAAGEVVIMLHGSGQNHLTWVLQSRYFAYRGFAVLAPDSPGHGLSGGSPLKSIEAMAKWVIELMDRRDVQQAMQVGHAQGCLCAIEAAAHQPESGKREALIAGAMAIPVSQELLDMSDKALTKAISAMISWCHGPMAHMHDNTQPGHSFIGYGQRLMALNDNDALRADLHACNTYKNGPNATKSITQPALCILAENDRMTPVKFGREMATTLNNAKMTIIAEAGHMLPAEHPAAVNAALRSFFQSS